MALRRRQLLLTTAATCAAAALPAAPARALPAAADVARRYADAIVIVERPCPTGGAACTPARSQGFIIASNGLLATLLPGLKEGDVVAVHGEGEAYSATAVVVDDDGLALLRLRALPSTPLSALGVGLSAGRTRWLIGLSREPRGVQAVVGGEEPGGLLVPVPRGAPVLNESHEVVAIAARGRGGGAIDVLPAERLRGLAARLAQRAADRGHTLPPSDAHR